MLIAISPTDAAYGMHSFQVMQSKRKWLSLRITDMDLATGLSVEFSIAALGRESNKLCTANGTDLPCAAWAQSSSSQLF